MNKEIVTEGIQHSGHDCAHPTQNNKEHYRIVISRRKMPQALDLSTCDCKC